MEIVYDFPFYFLYMDLKFVNQCQGDTKLVEEESFSMFCKDCNADLVFVQETHSSKEDYFFFKSVRQ